MHVISCRPAAHRRRRLAAPIWLDNGDVAWVENLGSDSAPMLSIYEHSDVTGGPFADGTPFVDCTASSLTTMEQIEVASLTPLTMIVAASP